MSAPRGFTLVELVAAIGIFALVAVMGLQALTAGLRSEAALAAAAEADRAVFRTLTLLRRDLEAAVPLAFLPPGGEPQPALDAPAGSGRLALSVGGLPRLPGEPSAGFGRVEWRVDPATARLTRRVWPVLAPRDGAAAGPEVAMLEGVRALALLPLPPGGDLRPDPFAGEDEALTRLPLGFEVTLETERHGRLRVVVAP